MRPVLLEMNGFGSFRDHAEVDFAGADFFALTGPTGAGKSTVIDAMTFALYGSVPRWNHRTMVSLALAPTATRGAVRLVFEAGGHRYVVARELRRAAGASGQVSQRNASVERLTDPAGLGRDGEQTLPLAADIQGVNRQVEQLLGLSFEDFCQCVVLPQGQFATFLQARPADRQKILLRLLGAEHYGQMMQLANQRATTAGERAGVYAGQLDGLADATHEAQDAAEAAERALAALDERTRGAVPVLGAAEQELAAARASVQSLTRERDALAAVRVPAGVATLDEARQAAAAAAGQARADEEAAGQADQHARAALAAGPQRAPLERVAAGRAELAGELEQVPGARASASQQADAAGAAAKAESQAAADADSARSRREAAQRRHDEAAAAVAQTQAQHAALAAVTVPPGTGELDERRQRAAGAVQAAEAALLDAEQAEDAARSARAGAVAPGPLEQARRDVAEIRQATGGLDHAELALDQARQSAEEKQLAAAEAEEARRRAQDELDAARREERIADLRPHLAQGHACPLCEQTVATLPPPLAAPATGAADKKVRAADAQVTAARTALSRAQAAVHTAADKVAGLQDQRAAARQRLAVALAAGGPLAEASLPALRDLAAGSSEPSQVTDRQESTAAAELDAAVRARQDLDSAADQAADAAGQARAAARDGQARLSRADAQVTAARADLSRARDPLVVLGAPPADGESLAAAWSRLHRWASEQTGVRAEHLAAARTAAAAAAAGLHAEQAAFTRAEAALAAARAAARDAALASQDAATRLAALTARVARLREQLAGAPDEQTVAADLARASQLEQAAADADTALRAARDTRAAADAQLSRLERDAGAAARDLARARDPLVSLGAPAAGPDTAGLLAAWDQLAAWAGEQAAVRSRDLAAATAALDAAAQRLADLTGQLSDSLQEAGIGGIPPGQVPARAPAAVAAALERARAQTARIAERREQAASLARQRDAETAQQQVAHMLGNLLRSDQFPRWLVTAAVDVLVADASQTLAGLSNGQYDLTHDDGEFYIIDHADADSRRSVRTLSGGETFQASLALALALSAQLTSLAAAGAARLDSIFLDEGFGTLDPDTLDVVATTLENLAQGPRMVGVVTHVAALAERVPVRFAVNRDNRTSTVVREGPGAPEAL